MTALEALLGPVSPQDIVGALEAGEIRHIACGGGERLRSVFGWPEFAALANVYEPDADTLKVTKDGQPVPSDWLVGGRDGLALNGTAFSRLAHQGISLTLLRLERRSPAMRALWHEMRRALNCPLQLGCIATFGEGPALVPHYDGCDLAIVQLAGSKAWEMTGERIAPPAHGRSVDVPTDAPFSATFTLHPGDVLIVPHGQRHRCWSHCASLHMGFAIERYTGFNYLNWFTDKMRDLPDLRPPVSFSDAPEAAEQFDDEVRRRLAFLMDRFSPKVFLSERRRLDDADPISAGHLPEDLEDLT